MRTANEVLGELQRVVEEGEQGDWAAYALGRPTGPGALAARPRIAALLAEASLPNLRLRGTLLAIDADPPVMELATLVDALEERGDDPADVLIELFARKELLARRAGHTGYAQLALAADGLSTADATAELKKAERTARAEVTVEVVDHAEPSADESDVWDLFRSFFAPLLDGVEVRFEHGAAAAGMSKALRWPDHIGVVVRPAGAAASAAERVASLGLTAHELGHALQWRARAARGLGFLDFFSLTALETETAADLGERLLFESEFGRDLPLPRALWTRKRTSDLLRLIGRARFELEVYAAALDAPGSLSALWGKTTGGSIPDSWSRDGQGFYTEDPMRRYTYALAYSRSAHKLAAVTMPPTARAIAEML